MTDYDSPWKEALDVWFEQFLAFPFPGVHQSIDWSRGYESLDQELRQVIREAELGQRVVDKLVRVWRLDGSETWVIVHVEIQAQYEADFAGRMFCCHYRLFDRFGRHPVNLAVLADDRRNWRPESYGSALWGCEVAFRFPTIKLLDFEDREDDLESDPNPFAVVVLTHLKTIATRQDAGSRQRWELRLIKGLYDRGFSRPDVLGLFRFIDWIMDLPQELESQLLNDLHAYEQETQMPYVTPMERLAIERGRVEGRVEAAREEILTQLKTGLEVKFGDDGLAAFSELEHEQSLDRLRSILQQLWTAQHLDELETNGDS